MLFRSRSSRSTAVWLKSFNVGHICACVLTRRSKYPRSQASLRATLIGWSRGTKRPKLDKPLPVTHPYKTTLSRRKPESTIVLLADQAASFPSSVSDMPSICVVGARRMLPFSVPALRHNTRAFLLHKELARFFLGRGSLCCIAGVATGLAKPRHASLF